jgi:hypothetical protein
MQVSGQPIRYDRQPPVTICSKIMAVSRVQPVSAEL